MDETGRQAAVWWSPNRPEAPLATLSEDSLPVRRDCSSPVGGVKNQLSVDLVADARDSGGGPLADERNRAG
jgi:hypothetical protein